MDFSQIALLMVVAASMAMIAKLLKQPMIVGYLFAGVILSAFGFVSDKHTLQELGQVGVSLLLFSVGLEMNMKEILSLGKSAFVSGIAQVILTTVLGFLFVYTLGFSIIPAFFIAFSLTFSSTIVVIKLLSEKNELQTLSGRLTLGFLLVQDLIAVFSLIFLSAFSEGGLNSLSIVLLIAKSALLFGILFLLSKYVLSHAFEKFNESSSELLFVVSIAWALGLSALVGGPLGLSLEIGGFLAGLSLSNLPANLQISGKTRNIRDFFLTIFFFVLGTDIVVGEISQIIVVALLLSLFVLISNPLVQFLTLSLLGYKKKVSFTSGLSIAQVSEFSLIFIILAKSLGFVGDREVSIVILVAVITMLGSTYLILYTEKIYQKVKGFLSLFERKSMDVSVQSKFSDLSGHVVLVGADRTGMVLISRLKKNFSFVVVDYNPKIINSLSEQKIPCVFGDINDEDIQKAVNLDKASLVISTSSHLHDSLVLLKNINSMKERPKIILKAKSKSDAIALYENKATYVLIPEVLSGEHIRHLLKNYGFSERLNKVGKSHHNRLREQ